MALEGVPFYCLHDIAQVGRLTGRRFLGGRDWYRVGCEYLVKIQKADGSWEGAGVHKQLDHQPVVATSFALLFLSGGQRPVLITKLAHGEADGWNNKWSDCRNLTGFASRQLFKKQPLAWQVFDVRKVEADLRGDPEEAGGPVAGQPHSSLSTATPFSSPRKSGAS